MIRLHPSRRFENEKDTTFICCFRSCSHLGLPGVLSSFDTPIGVQPAAVHAALSHVLTLDVAADCRTLSPGLNRGETNMVTGKIFPGGTLPRGTADNDPALPVNGVAPIGDWHHRSQNALPLPPDIAAAYSSTPPVLATFYFFFNNGAALVTEAWGIIEVNGVPTVPGVIVGGIGRFSGAAGDGRGHNNRHQCDRMSELHRQFQYPAWLNAWWRMEIIDREVRCQPAWLSVRRWRRSRGNSAATESFRANSFSPS